MKLIQARLKEHFEHFMGPAPLQSEALHYLISAANISVLFLFIILFFLLIILLLLLFRL
jgi:hypothetical protein